MAGLILSRLLGTLKTSFGVGKATFDASGLTAARTLTVPDRAGTFRLRTPSVQSVASNSSITPDISVYDFLDVTALGVNSTINNPTGTPSDGQQLSMRILDDGTSRTLSWGTAYDPTAFGASVMPPFTFAGKHVYIDLVYHYDAGKWDMVNCRFEGQPAKRTWTATKTDAATTTSTYPTWTTTGLGISGIIPRSTNSKFWITASWLGAADAMPFFRFADGSSNPILQGDSNGSKGRGQLQGFAVDSGVNGLPFAMCAPWSPGSTSSQTVNLEWCRGGGSASTQHFNQIRSEVDSTNNIRGAAAMSVTEVSW